MLARGNRITRGAEYKAVVRGGARCAAAHTVTYVALSGEDRAPRFGFLVSKQVGSAVTRNTVRRRLKALCAEAMPQDHWQFYLNAVGKAPETRAEKYGDFRFVSANSQGDVGYDMVFLPYAGGHRLVFMRDWSMHEEFYYGGNFRIGEKAEAALSAQES